MPAKKKPKTPKSIETLTHAEEKRRNIPTAEFQAMVERGEADPLTVAYERRNRDLDPQLTDYGSIFVQIGDENVHRFRAFMEQLTLRDSQILTKVAA